MIRSGYMIYKKDKLRLEALIIKMIKIYTISNINYSRRTRREIILITKVITKVIRSKKLDHKCL